MHVGYVKLAIFGVAIFAVYKMYEMYKSGGTAGPATTGGVGPNGTFAAFNTDMGGVDFGAAGGTNW